MIEFILNDGGRRASGRKGKTGDCLIRAIAIAGSLDYDLVYKRAAMIYKVAGYCRTGNALAIGRNKVKRSVKHAQETQRSILREFGFEKVRMRSRTKPTMTQAWHKYGDCIVTITGHICALKDGALQDTMDIREYMWDDGWRQRKVGSIWTLDPEILKKFG